MRDWLRGDPLGDTTATHWTWNDGVPTISSVSVAEPRADITTAAVDYTPSKLGLPLEFAQPFSMQRSLSSVEYWNGTTWYLETTGDDNADFVVEMPPMLVELADTFPEPIVTVRSDSATSSKHMCSGKYVGAFPNTAELSLELDPKECLGSPARIRVIASHGFFHDKEAVGDQSQGDDGSELSPWIVPSGS